MKLISTLFLLLVGLHSMAQKKIGGKVIDKATKEPLEFACIQIGSSKKIILTDQNGVFSIAPSKSISIRVTHIGYHTKELDLTDARNLIIELDKGPVDIPEVVITPQINNGSFHTISRLDLNLQPAKTSQEALRIVPGLFIAQHAGGGKAEQIFLRGFDIDHGTDISIGVDGLPVNMVSHAHGQGYADLHFLIPETIANIDWGKGPYYSQQGNFNTAGYVNFQTLNRLERNEVRIEAGQFNTLRTVAMIDLLGKKQKDKGTNAYIAGEFMYTDGPFESPQYFNRFNLFGKFNSKLGENNRLSIALSTFNSKWNASGQIPERTVKSGMIGRFGAIDDTEGGYTNRTNTNIKLSSYLKNNAVLENQLYYTNYNFSLFSNFTFFLEDSINGDQIHQKEARNIFGGLSRLKLPYQLKEWNLTSTFAAGFRADETNNSELSHTKNRTEILEPIQLGDINQLNAFAYIDQSFLKNKWLLDFGLRFDYFRNQYTDKLNHAELPVQSEAIISPKLNIQYTFNPRWQVYLKTGKGFHSNDTRVVAFNNGKDILPAAYGTDLGLTFKPVSHLFIDVAIWYLYLEQEFVYVGDAGVIEPSGKTERKGVDLSARYQFNSWLFADLNLNLTKPRSMESPKAEDYIPLAPTFTSTGGLNFKMGNGFNGSIRYRYMKDRPANETNTVIAHGYTVADLSLNYTRKKYELGIAIENFFNVKWNEAQFNTESRLKNEPVSVEEIHFTPGVPFYARLKLSFFF